MFGKIVASAMVMAGSLSSAQAAQIVCGDPLLGLRVTTVDPAKACTYAGLQNLGDPALEALLDSLLTPVAPAVDDAQVLDRDSGNGNGGFLSITGVGGFTGTWTIDPLAWGYDRLFLYFHFGDAKDDPSATSITDPDTFIVELSRADITGSWTFGGTGAKLTGLSNIALLSYGTPDEPPKPPVEVPEPGSALLAGLALLGLAGARRLRRG
jgi:MYXO-CTERM domain-containing protein